MTSLREIRKQIRSVGNIKQITKAMEMVAASRLRRAQAKAEQSRPYISHLQELVGNLSSIDVHHPLFEKKAAKKIGVIIIAADKGLCGSYNTAIFSKADKFLRHYSPEEVELILIGRKALNYYENKKWIIRHRVSEGGGKISSAQVKALANQCIQWFVLGELGEIWLIYTHYITVLSRQVVIEKFLNIEKLKRDETQPITLSYIFEPNLESIYAELLPCYVITKLQMALDEAHASELAARVISMKTAHKNADEMIGRLMLIHNKVRQASITKEMLEITSGAENLK